MLVTKINKILGEINPGAQRKTRMFPVVPHIQRPTILNTLVTRFGVVHVCARHRYSGKIVEHVTMARKNNLVIYEEICRLMITFFIYKMIYFRALKYFEVSYSLFRN